MEKYCISVLSIIFIIAAFEVKVLAQSEPISSKTPQQMPAAEEIVRRSVDSIFSFTAMYLCAVP